MRVAMYARVSKDDLHCENQKQYLMKWVTDQGLPETDWAYFEEELSSRKTRPIKEQIIQDFREGRYDTIVVTRIDRFARSIQELIMNVEEIIQKNGRFVSLMNNFDFQSATYNASQQLMLNIFASFAQFERELIRERTLEGLARARAEGRVGGRPRKTPIVHPTLKPQEERIVKTKGGEPITDVYPKGLG